MTKLSEICGKRYTLPEDPHYHIEAEAGDNLLIVASVIADKKNASFDHPNILLKRPEVLEFKYYRHNGGKYWVAKPGIAFYFLVPKDRIEIVPEKLYSYVKVLIGGKKYTLNVSGHGSAGEWTDFFGNVVHISVGHPVHDLKTLADNSLSPEALPLDFNFPERDTSSEDRQRELQRWQWLLAEKIARKALTIGSTLICSESNYTVERLNRTKTQIVARRNPYGGLYRIHKQTIDWTKTAEANGIQVPVPAPVFRARKTA